MPTKRTRRSRHLRADEQPSAGLVAFFKAGEWPVGVGNAFEQFALREDELRQRWEACREDILRAWIAEHPGTRPAAWWTYDAPHMVDVPERWRGHFYTAALREPRRRIGGVGAAAAETFCYVPEFRCGIPMNWASIDALDPPAFESQASYLDRHGLLRSGERTRLVPANFEAEFVDDALSLTTH